MDDERMPVDWFVPEEELSRFEDYVEAEFGAYEGELGRRVEEAMREYAELDTDDAASEALLDECLAHSADEEEKQKTTTGLDTLANKDTRRAQSCVNPYVRMRFKQWAGENSDDCYGVELARALRQYRTNSRSSRIRSKLERFVDSEMDESPMPVGGGSDDHGNESATDDEEGTRESGTVVDRRVQTLVDQIHGKSDKKQLHVDKDIRPLLAACDGITDDPAPQTVDKYADLIAEELDLKRHPRCSELYIPSEEFPRKPDHIPTECWVPVSELDRNPVGRARRVCIETGYRAISNNGKASIDTDEILDEVLEGEISKRTARETMKKAAEFGGNGFNYTTSHGAKKRVLKVNLNVLQEHNPELYNEIVRYYNGETGSEDESDQR
ncbi:hypothetical protein [Natronosalvus rutilus]|uniref:Uncharacterized protein n=1 Tax=Natronosalvus rutilus TaxID=2953753 RepID=A0A9E7NAU1_9EURY|nr:hypothetical protein [Natronosalvus rutilus]UTF53257.1 hypothetical protein NGM29_16010 [Natronosalvus rutilus]